MGLAFVPAAAAAAGGIRITKPSPTATRPITNLPGLEGSRPPAASLTQIHANTGASVKMKNEFTLWNQLLGNVMPNRRVSVSRSAKRFSVDPACSNTDQNSADARKSTATTTRRRRSAGVQSPLVNSHPKKTTVESSRPTPAAFAMPTALTGSAPV